MSNAFTEKELRGLIDAFSAVEEYRKNTLNVRHKLCDIIAITVCAVIAGADGPSAIIQWAKVHQEKLTRILRLKNGIPSRDTIRRTLEAIEPAAFQKCFLEWIDSFRESSRRELESGKKFKKEHVAIDGKTLRRSHDENAQLSALHIVSAYATDHGISLGQLATEEKSNEITAIPELLDALSLDGSVVSIDAMGTQTKIAEKIISKNAGYVLAVKDNQPKLHQAVKDFFADVSSYGTRTSVFVEDEVSHGRIEHREYYQATIPPDFAETRRFPNAETIGMVIRTHTAGDGKIKTETRYFISSERRNGANFACYVRRHWAIENSLHWVLDMTFREDESRIRDRVVADNLSWIRRFTITLLKRHPSKTSLVGKRRQAGWSFDFLMELILGIHKTPDFTEK